MLRPITIRISTEEEAQMRRQMEIAGETELGPHIRRVYFGRLNPGEGVLPELRKNTELALSMLAELRKSGDGGQPVVEAEGHDRDLELRLLAAIFFMLRMSVGKDQRLMIDRFIDHQAIENFLKSGGEL